MSMNADLHMHSTCSDGQYAPEELMELAFANGANVVSLTDHDTVSGVKRAREAAGTLGMCFIGGIEISTGEGGEIHVLGYGIDEDNRDLKAYLDRQRESRKDRIPKVLNKLNDLGIHLDIDRVFARASGSVGRPHIADEMVDAGYVAGREEAFNKYLKEGAAAYVPRDVTDTAEAIGLIRGCGGIPVLAHPGLIKKDTDTVKRLIAEWTGNGLMGLEVYYPAHKKNGYEPWLELAKEYGLLVTGGSDFHKDADTGEDHGGIASVSRDWIRVEQDIDSLFLRSNL